MIVNDDLKHCVGFIGHDGAEGFELIGTCFFISMEDDSGLVYFHYLVTAKHVIKIIASRNKDICVRLNTNLGAQKIPTPLNEWIFHHDASVDIAVFPFPIEGADEIQYKTIPIVASISEKDIKENKIRTGYDIFSAGLFFNRPGDTRNIPIIRVGNISAMPEEPIYLEELGFIEAYLIETRSLGGLSGSPVFVSIHETPEGTFYAKPIVYWLGVMQGHWENKRVDDNIQPINVGIAFVIPAHKVLEIINQNDLVQGRDLQIKEWKKRQSPILD